MQAVLNMECSAGERLLRAVLNHFDRILAQREFQSLMQQEMVRFHRGESDSMPILVKTMFTPMFIKMQSLIEEGINSGELCQVKLVAKSGVQRLERTCFIS